MNRQRRIDAGASADFATKGAAVMGRGRDLTFAAPTFVIGLCVMLLLGRAPGTLAGFVVAGLVICVMHTGRLRIATLALLLCAGIVIALLGGATPERIISDMARFWTAGDRLALFMSPGNLGELRLGCGLFGAGLCALAFAVFSGNGRKRALREEACNRTRQHQRNCNDA